LETKNNLSQYHTWISELKSKIQSSQIKAAIAVNSEMILLYFGIGKDISILSENSQYGDKIIEQIAQDLTLEFPNLKGFSFRNLRFMKQFANYYSNNFEIVKQLVSPSSIEGFIQNYSAKIPWGHNIAILQKTKSIEESIFYIRETISNNWSRDVLKLQIDSKLHDRQGKAIHNFELTLPKPQSDLANQILKDPYNFGFLTLEKNVQELELERKLVQNITNFLLELGKGFAYMGNQFKLDVGETENRLDLLFYHTKLKCYIVIELKIGDFKPEYIGKLNYYLSAIDSLVKDDTDNPTMGILLCKSKNKLNVEFSLKDINKPIGVSEYIFNELPLEIQRELPTVEELEEKLNLE
jgi:predicted nuclease of restriction endonuclease-like (RecB) superfamily